MNKSTGFTLIELMIAVAVLAILLAVGVPSFRTIIQDNRLSAHTNQLVGALNLARAESVKRGVAITVCGSDNGSSCNTTNWGKGWIIFADTNGDRSLGASDTIIKVQQPPSGNIKISAVGFNNSSHIQYLPSGFSADQDDGSFVFCDKRDADSANAINLNPSGRPAIGTDSDDSGAVEDYAGSNISC